MKNSMCLAGMPFDSCQAFPDFLITAHHLCAFLMELARYLCDGKTHIHTKKDNRRGGEKPKTQNDNGDNNNNNNNHSNSFIYY